MSLSHRYRQLAALIDALESCGITVQHAEPVDDGEDEHSLDGRFAVRFSVELPADAPLDSFSLERGVSDRRPTSASPGTVGTNLARTGEHPTSQQTGGTDAVRDEASTDEDAPGLETTDSATDETEGTDEPDGRDGADAGNVDVDGPEPTATDAEAADAEAADEATSAVDTDERDTISCTHPDCDRTFETERGMKIHRTKAHPLSDLADAASDRTVHHDPEVLADVYDEYETFAEMTDALGVDVGAQAVRKQMIRHGIHEPGTASSGESVVSKDVESDRSGEREDTSADESDASVVAMDDDSGPDGGDDGPDTSDGDSAGEQSDDDGSRRDQSVADRLPDLNLPGSLSAAELQAAVETASTLYEVQRALGLDRETTRDILTEYDLLELVSGRAASVRDREELKAEINQRIRRTAT